MIRSYEGIIRLQGIGVVEGIKAKNIKIGDVLVWNFGGTSKVIAIEFSKTGKTLTITVEYVNYSGEIETAERRLNAERIVAVKDLNPVEVEETVEVEEVEAVETEEMKADFEEAQKWINYVRKYKDMKYYVEAQGYYRKYRKVGGNRIIEHLEHPEKYKELLEEDVKKAEQPKKKISQYEKWIRTFIEEKGLDLDLEFTIEHDNITHFIAFGFIIDLIVKAPKQEQEQIKDKIVYIDFRNGDVIHFFEFLANAYIKTNY